MANAAAYALRDDYVGSPEGQSFGAFPGVWVPGEPQRPEAFGFDADSFAALIEKHNIPLVRVTVEETGAPVEAASTADVVSQPPAVLTADASGVPGLSVAELEERDRFDAARKARSLPGGGEIPQTFTPPEDAPAAAAQTPTLPAPDLETEHRAELEPLTIAELLALAPEGSEVPSSPKSAVIDALVAAGIHPPAPGEEG